MGSLGMAQAQSYHHHMHRVCHDVRVRDRSSDSHRIAGTAIGAVAGGLLGHQVGGGSGKTLATVGGAVAGGYVGNRVQKNNQENNGRYHIERRCHDVED
ncbi:MAG TPA: glycine zipper 2TM domain-containing protein [Rhodanobacter sp.]